MRVTLKRKTTPADLCPRHGSASEAIQQIIEPGGSVILLSPLCKALAAVYGTVVAGLEGKHSFAAAIVADSYKGLALTAGTGLSLVTAGLAALGLVLKAFAGIELLLAGSENEFLTTVFANESFVFVHFFFTSLRKIMISP